jgi:Zn-dependent metalloprotease
MKKLFLLQLISFLSVFAFSQNKNNKSDLIYFPTTSLTLDNFYRDYCQEFGIRNNNIEFRKVRSHNPSHQKFEQYYKGLKVKNSISILHLLGDRVDHMTGNVYNVNEMEIHPTIDENKVKHIAEAVFYKETKLTKTSDIKITSELVVANKNYPSDDGVFVLAYDIIISSPTNHEKRQIIIDANNGQIVFQQNLIHRHNVPSKGKTYHYGEQTFMVDSLSPNVFELRDTERNISSSHFREFNLGVARDDDNYWEYDGKDIAIIDAHYCTSRFYDMMKNKFGYDGIDGNHGAMNSALFPSKTFVNAFWDGQSATFGKGDCHYAPLTTLSIVGHEFMHGITDYQSNLIYDDESGALNEAYSDVFGKALEYYEDNAHFTWELDSKIADDEYATPFRSMSDPELYDCPAMYKGTLWNDNADVHTNSSILNHWFYLMVQGKSGTNEAGYTYNISAQPILDVLDILFTCQTSYLTESSDYHQMYIFSEQVCKDKHGASSSIYQSLIDAWKAVGLPYDGGNISVDNDLAVEFDHNNFITECAEIGNKLDAKFFLKNNGNNIVPAGTIVNVEVNYLETYEVLIEKDLIKGQSIEIVISEAIDVHYYGFQFLSVRIINEDEISTNNENYTFYEVYSPIPNLSLQYYNLIDNTCFTNSISMEVNLVNNSCDKVFSDGDVIIYVKNNANEIVHEIVNEINFDLFRGIITSFNIEIPKSVLSNNEEYQLYMEYEEDENISDNSARFVFEEKFLDKAVSYDFDFYGFEDFIIDGNFISGYNYQNATFFKAEPFFTSIPCKNLADQEITGSLSTCLDVSGFNYPILGFDMVQFRSDFITNPLLAKNSNVLQFQFFDQSNNLIKEEIVTGSNEGVLDNYFVPILEKFKGRLVINFYQSYSTDFGLLDLHEADVTLIDNFILDDFVSNDEIIKDNTYKVYPNPTNNVLNVKGESDYVYTITDINGRMILSGKSIDKGNAINVSNLCTGAYTLNMVDDTKVTKVKWIKI